MTALKLCPREAILAFRSAASSQRLAAEVALHVQNAALYPLALVACSLARSADAITSRIRVNSVW